MEMMTIGVPDGTCGCSAPFLLQETDPKPTATRATNSKPRHGFGRGRGDALSWWDRILWSNRRFGSAALLKVVEKARRLGRFGVIRR